MGLVTTKMDKNLVPYIFLNLSKERGQFLWVTVTFPPIKRDPLIRGEVDPTKNKGTLFSRDESFVTSHVIHSLVKRRGSSE